MYIFELEGELVRPTVHALLIPSIRKVWDTDQSEAIKHFSYIEFTCSKRKTNPFQGYDPKLIDAKVKDKIYGDSEYILPMDVIQAKKDYLELQQNGSTALRFLDAAKHALESTIDYFKNQIDYTERNKSGMPVYKPKDVLSALADSDKVLTALHKLKEKVEEELYESVKTVGNRAINPFEQ